MSDQRKLIPLEEPSVDLRGEGDTRIDTSEMGSAAGRLGSLEPTRLEQDHGYLPPLPAKNLPRPTADSAVPAAEYDSEMTLVRRFSAVILILMTGSLAGFLTGVAGGVLLFTGILDIDSAWIKGVVDIFRGN